jgi:hypothetical protein
MKLWGISFIEIESEWTDDQFIMMTQRLTERLNRENKATKDRGRRDNSGSGSSGGGVRKSVGTKEFMGMLQQKPKAKEKPKA